MKDNPTPEPSREKRTRYVVLGMLLQGPANGYALRQRISATVGNFWQESFGQLYPTLRALEVEGLVLPGADLGPKGAQAYEISAAGRLALRDWLARPPQPQPERNELLLKVFFAELAPLVVAEHIARAKSEARRLAERLRKMRSELQQDLAGQLALPAWLATLDYGLAGQAALEAWCGNTLSALGKMSTPNARASRVAGSQSKKSKTKRQR